MTANIKITEANNLLISFTNAAAKQVFLEKKNFLYGTISEIKYNYHELKVVIKDKFTDIENESIKDIDKLEELKSFIKYKKKT